MTGMEERMRAQWPGWIERAAGKLATAASSPVFTASAILGAMLVGLLRLVVLVKENAVDLLFEDQWDLLTPLFEDSGAWAAFCLQHGPHRQGLGGLANWFLYR